MLRPKEWVIWEIGVNLKNCVKIKETYDNWDEITKSEKQLELFTMYRAHNGFESDPN